jgi:hypothetical protein
VTSKYRPIAILTILFLMHVLAHVDRNLLTAFAPQIVVDLAINNAQFGFLAGAVWVLSYSAASLVTGAFSDRYSRTRILSVSVLIWSACAACAERTPVSGERARGGEPLAVSHSYRHTSATGFECVPSAVRSTRRWFGSGPSVQSCASPG